MSDWLRFVVVMGIFIFVLFITYLSTRFIATFQKTQGGQGNHNIEVLETQRITNNKYLQIVKVGTKHFVIAICKDSVTFLVELSDEEAKQLSTSSQEPLDFKEILEKVKKIKLKK